MDSMPSAIRTLAMSSGFSAFTLYVEWTTEAPSTSNSPLASVRISTHGSKAGNRTEREAWVSRWMIGRLGRAGSGPRSLYPPWYTYATHISNREFGDEGSGKRRRRNCCLKLLDYGGEVNMRLGRRG